MAELLLAEEAEEARETPEPTTTTTSTTATKEPAKADDSIDAVSNNADDVKTTPDHDTSAHGSAAKLTPPAVKISGVGTNTSHAAASKPGVEKSPVDAISTWSEDGCHVFMPNWGETSSTNVSLLGKRDVIGG